MAANETQVGGTHYKHAKIQHWDWSWYSSHDAFQYQITKYVDRHKRKNGLQDLRKAQHFLEKYIELLIQDGVYQDDKATLGDGILEREWEHATLDNIDEFLQELEPGHPATAEASGPGPHYVNPDREHTPLQSHYHGDVHDNGDDSNKQK